MLLLYFTRVLTMNKNEKFMKNLTARLQEVQIDLVNENRAYISGDNSAYSFHRGRVQTSTKKSKTLTQTQKEGIKSDMYNFEFTIWQIFFGCIALSKMDNLHDKNEVQFSFMQFWDDYGNYMIYLENKIKRLYKQKVDYIKILKEERDSLFYLKFKISLDKLDEIIKKLEINELQAELKWFKDHLNMFYFEIFQSSLEKSNLSHRIVINFLQYHVMGYFLMKKVIYLFMTRY